MSNKCPRCGRFAGLAEGAKCVKCSSLYHRDCAKLSPSGSVSAKWACDDCQKDKRKQIKSLANKGLSTPSLAVSDTTNPTGLSAASSTACITADDNCNNNIVAELRLLRNEMASFRGEIAQLNVTLSGINARVDNIESRLSLLEERPIVCETGESNSLQSVISQLKSELNDRDQQLLLNDVQISGLEELPGENLLNISVLVGKKLGVDISKTDVVFAERVGSRRAISVDVSDRAQGRQRPVVIRLARRAVRDELLRAARVRRAVDSSGIVDAEPRRFYVNERLTRSNKQLFYKTREVGRNKNCRFVWTKGGFIYIRQNDKAPVHRVRTESDLDKLFTDASF